MIMISSNELQVEDLGPQFPLEGTAKIIIDTLVSSSEKYYYDSIDELKFEIRLREEIIKASRKLLRSGLRFEIFREAECNSDYWDRTQQGGFKLRQDVKPSDAVRDIYQNGRKYGTECATAMMIVYYKALLEVYGDDLFDQTFPKIQFMNWHYIDRNLREVGYITKRTDYFPGDRRYFANPDVDPTTPEWQGENVIDLGNGLYYGHGVGIQNADVIIRALNKNRSSDADESASLLDSAGRPNFKRLFGIYDNFRG